MSPAYTCAVGLRVQTCWLHNINLVETLKLVKYRWTEIRNLDRILDGIGDFGRTENEILDSMFVQSLTINGRYDDDDDDDDDEQWVVDSIVQCASSSY